MAMQAPIFDGPPGGRKCFGLFDQGLSIPQDPTEIEDRATQEVQVCIAQLAREPINQSSAPTLLQVTDCVARELTGMVSTKARDHELRRYSSMIVDIDGHLTPTGIIMMHRLSICPSKLVKSSSKDAHAYRALAVLNRDFSLQPLAHTPFALKTAMLFGAFILPDLTVGGGTWAGPAAAICLAKPRLGLTVHDVHRFRTVLALIKHLASGTKMVPSMVLIKTIVKLVSFAHPLGMLLCKVTPEVDWFVPIADMYRQVKGRLGSAASAFHYPLREMEWDVAESERCLARSYFQPCSECATAVESGRYLSPPRPLSSSTSTSMSLPP